MTAAAEPTSTAVARPRRELPAAAQQRVDEARERSAMSQAIRGTIWGKDLSDAGVRAVGMYAARNNIDAVRHVEVLGGRIYLTAELYEERGAPLMQAGLIRKDEPDYINADDRLEKLAAAGDEWAKTESVRRQRERIRYNAPENAKAICVTRLWLKGNDTPIVGVNWCGGLPKKDPVGDAEPTKTAASRSARRAWKQIVEIVPSYGQQFEQLHATAYATNEVIVEERAKDRELTTSMRTKALAPGSGEYSQAEIPMPTTEQAVARARRALEEPDPYTGKLEAEEEPLDDTDLDDSED